MYWGWSPSRITRPSLYPESGASTPPSSLYCCQRSASISSAAARSWRIATSPALSLCLPLAANALLALPSKAAPGARRAAPMPRLRRKDRLARRRGCGNSWLGFDDSALSRSLITVGLISDFIEWTNIGLVLVSAWRIALPTRPYRCRAILFPKSLSRWKKLLIRSYRLPVLWTSIKNRVRPSAIR